VTKKVLIHLLKVYLVVQSDIFIKQEQFARIIGLADPAAQAQQLEQFRL